MAMNFSSRQQGMAGGDQSGSPVDMNDNHGMTNGHTIFRSFSHHYNQGPEFPRRATIWMGDVDESMDEGFLKQAFAQLGEQVAYVKVHRNKVETANGYLGYAFVEFNDQETAQRVLESLNGKAIPNSQGKYFKLNPTHPRNFGYKFGNRRFSGHSTYQVNTMNEVSSPKASPQSSTKGSSRPSSRSLPGNTAPSSPGQSKPATNQSPNNEAPRTYTAFVGDLDAELTSEEFESCFKSLFPSVYSCVLVKEPSGVSKRYGFVRFLDETEFKTSLSESGRIKAKLGCDNLRISVAHPPKNHDGSGHRRQSLQPHHFGYHGSSASDFRDQSMRRSSAQFPQHQSGRYNNWNNWLYNPNQSMNRGFVTGMQSPNPGVIPDPNIVGQQYQSAALIASQDRQQFPHAMQMQAVPQNVMTHESSQNMVTHQQAVNSTSQTSFPVEQLNMQPYLQSCAFFGGPFYPTQEVYPNIPGFPYYPLEGQVPQSYWTPTAGWTHPEMYGQVAPMAMPVTAVVSPVTPEGDSGVDARQVYYQGASLTNMNQQPYSQQQVTKPDVIPLVQQKQTIEAASPRVTNHHNRK